MKIGWWERLVRKIMRMPVPQDVEDFQRSKSFSFYDGTTEAVALGIIFEKTLDKVGSDS